MPNSFQLNTKLRSKQSNNGMVKIITSMLKQKKLNKVKRKLKKTRERQIGKLKKQRNKKPKT